MEFRIVEDDKIVEGLDGLSLWLSIPIERIEQVFDDVMIRKMKSGHRVFLNGWHVDLAQTKMRRGRRVIAAPDKELYPDKDYEIYESVDDAHIKRMIPKKAIKESIYTGNKYLGWNYYYE